MKRILITENVEANVALFKDAFAALDDSYVVAYVSTGQACLDYLQTSDNYDLCFVLLDLNVPGVIENNVLSKLTMDEAFRTIPVIVFSENISDDEIIKCYNDGASAFVRRPSVEEGYKQVIATITDFWTNVNVLAKPEGVVEF